MTRLEQLIADSRKLSDTTKRNYANAVRQFVEFAGSDPAIDWTPASVDAWCTQLKARGALHQSINTHLFGLRWASRRRHEVDDAPDFARPVERFAADGRKRATGSPRALSVGEARQLLATCAGRDPVSLRDRVIILLGIRVGLREFEMCGLRWADHPGPTLTVKRKGNKIETLSLDASMVEALDCLRVVSSPYGPTLPILRRASAQLSARGLSVSGIVHIVAQRAALAGLEVAPHELRHTFVSHMLLAGVDPVRAQQAAGHARLETTMGYAHDLAAASDPIGAALAKLVDEDP